VQSLQGRYPVKGHVRRVALVDVHRVDALTNDASVVSANCEFLTDIAALPEVDCGLEGSLVRLQLKGAGKGLNIAHTAAHYIEIGVHWEGLHRGDVNMSF
jgi:hypothetical protein